MAADLGSTRYANCNSFSADTPVATKDGQKDIGDIQAGDHVLAYDEATGSTGVYTITATIHHHDQVEVVLTLGGERIETTPEHPFYVLLRGWVDAADLHSGDQVRQLDGDYGAVQAVALEDRPQEMYNLTVAVAHTFFVGEGRWLVHNAECLVYPDTVVIDEHGQKLADGAELFYMELSGRQMDSTTVAVTTYRDRLYVTTNGGAPSGAISRIKKVISELQDQGHAVKFVDHTFKARTFIDPSTGSRIHAEKYLYEHFADQGILLDGIGVGHKSGPCPVCQGYFDNLGSRVPLYWNSRWKVGWIR